MRAFALLPALFAAYPSQADPIMRWQPLIDAAAGRCGVPASWIARVMRAESGGLPARDGRPIRSRAGAIGLMQLMPDTWLEMRQRLLLGDDPDDPADNILAGSCYLRLLYDRFGFPGLFAAYNAGPARYTAHLVSGNPLPLETRRYLIKVAETSKAPAAGIAAGVFVLRLDDGAVHAADARLAASSSSDLFAIRKPER